MSNYKLTYFDARGRGEISRLIFAAASVDYIDERIQMKDWPSVKNDTPLGQMPVLSINPDLKLVQSISIARFLAKRFHLTGINEIEQVQCDVIVDTCGDFLQQYVSKVFSVPEDQKENALKKFLTEETPKHLENLEKLIKMYGNGMYSVGNSLTWSDLMIFHVFSSIQEKAPNLLETSPRIEKVKKVVEENPNISAWLKKRPQTAF